jgi:hypothetical protein
LFFGANIRLIQLIKAAWHSYRLQVETTITVWGIFLTMRRVWKKYKKYVAIASFFAVLLVPSFYGPIDGWKLWLAIAVSIPYSIWVLLALTEDERERNRELNRAADEMRERKYAAEERSRIYNENYEREGRILKNRILDDLKAIGRGEKTRLDREAIEATKAIADRQGINNPGVSRQHPEFVAWSNLIDDLSVHPLKDPKAAHSRLDDLLYPETLEDIQALKKKLSTDEGELRVDPEALEAIKALDEITARDMRRRREEAEAEARARRLQRERDTRDTVRTFLRLYGLPETTLDGLAPDEARKQMRAIEEYLNELKNEPDEVREQALSELPDVIREARRQRQM